MRLIERIISFINEKPRWASIVIFVLPIVGWLLSGLSLENPGIIYLCWFIWITTFIYGIRLHRNINRSPVWCGTLIVDTGQNPGICLYVFSGEALEGGVKPSPEGTPEWLPFNRLSEIPVVEDLPVLLGRIHQMRRGDPPFAARSFYDEAGQLTIVFGN